MADRNEKGQFVKGNSGNPTGRAPKDREERYYEILKTTVTFDEWASIIKKAVDQAKRGDSVARKWLSDYLIGPPVQRQELTGAEGGDIKHILEVVYTNKAAGGDA